MEEEQTTVTEQLEATANNLATLERIMKELSKKLAPMPREDSESESEPLSGIERLVELCELRSRTLVDEFSKILERL